MTLDKLAQMVARGFGETATKAEMAKGFEATATKTESHFQALENRLDALVTAVNAWNGLNGRWGCESK